MILHMQAQTDVLLGAANVCAWLAVLTLGLVWIVGFLVAVHVERVRSRG